MRPRTTARLLTIVAASSALTLTACGSAGDEAVNKVLEKNGVKVKSDGKDSGTVEITGKDGEKLTISGGKKLPEGFPSDVPLPDGAQIESGSAIEAEGGRMFTVSAEVEQSAQQILDFYKDELADFKNLLTSTTDDGGMATWEGSANDVMIVVTKESGKTKLGLTVTPHKSS